MSKFRKKPEADLRRYYTLFLEFGLILTLLIFIVAAKVTLVGGDNSFDASQEQELVETEEIIQTQQEKTPPPPPRPQVPVEVPNDEIIEDDIIDLSSDLDLDEALDLPPPPAQQAEEEEEEDFFMAVEQDPVLIGGIQALNGKIDYPEKARRAGIEGMVIVQFTVNVDGTVQDPQIIRGLEGGCNEAAIEGIMKYAKFEPGRQRGEPVRVRYSLPINFRLTN